MRAAHVCPECHVADPQHVLGPAGAHGGQVGAALTSALTIWPRVLSGMGSTGWVVWQSWHGPWAWLLWAVHPAVFVHDLVGHKLPTTA